MRFPITPLLLIFVFVVTVSAQNPKPAPTPPAEGEVVKISTNLIQLDVSVTDAKGRPIVDLKPEDIEVYENGKKQRITNLSFVSDVREISKAEKKKDKPTIDVPVPTSEIRPEQVRRTFALVVDDLSLSFESAHYTRMALKKFVDEQMQEGDLVAIIRTGAGMGSLQQFSSDKRLLRAAIERVRWNPMGTGGISAFAPIEPTASEQAASMGLIDRSSISETEKNMTNAQNDLRGSIFAAGTLGAIRYLINGMSQLPGRKSIILFSNGFRIFTRDESGYEDGRLMLDLIRRLIDLANRASVVVHTIDARGLVYTGYTAADNVTDMSIGAMTSSMDERADELFETQQSLSMIAKETGGLSIRNNNDLSDGVRRVLEDQSYYLLAYEPEDETFDAAKARFNKISVKVLRPGATVRTRSGFFNSPDRETIQNSLAAATPYRQIVDALSSPFAHSGIELRLNPLFGHDSRNGSYVRSYLHINAKDLKFVPESGGKNKAVFTIVAASFGDSGKPTSIVSNTYTINVAEKEYRKILSEGFVYNFTFPVKKPGGFQYRVALRDDLAAVVGSASQFVQIPKIKKDSITLSSLVVQNFTVDEWKKVNSGVKVDSDPVNDTSLRRFRQGTVLQYAAEVYGLEANAAKLGTITRKVRVFRDGKLIMDGSETPLIVNSAGGKRSTAGALSLGSEMEPGDYILQIAVIDNSKKEDKRYSTQAVQFEIVP